jgi:hypothetical protein
MWSGTENTGFTKLRVYIYEKYIYILYINIYTLYIYIYIYRRVVSMWVAVCLESFPYVALMLDTVVPSGLL